MKNNLSVKQLSLYIKNVFEDELFLQNISVFGEVFEVSMGGKYTFVTIKEDDTLLSCVCFKRIILPKVGNKVLLHGSVNFNQKSTKVSFVFDECTNIGEGLYQAEFLKLKNKLKNLGFFDKKILLPQFITKVCIITSNRGSVIHDFLSGIENGHSYIQVEVLSSAVQGSNAEAEIISNLKKADKSGFDVIVLARGGGSANDLECFNKEDLAIAVATAQTPIISAIGHETDYSLCDFCASYRAGTPSYAAKIITENNQAIIGKFLLLVQKMSTALERKHRQNAVAVSNAMNKISHSATDVINKADGKLRYLCANIQESIKNSAISKEKRLNLAHDKFLVSSNNLISTSEQRFSQICTQLNYLNPLKALSLGYSVVTADNKRVTSINQVEVGQNIDMIFSDGKINAEIKAKERY